MVSRIKFTKTGSAKFIGHLDLLRYFQKAFKRAKIDLTYSQGYSPHSMLTFASPLGVGSTSEGEYLDVTLNSSDKPSEMLNRINDVMADNIHIIDFTILPDDSKNAMSAVSASDYIISLKDGYDFLSLEEFQDRFRDFYNQESIKIIKKTKKSEREVDLKPSIYKFGFTNEEFNNFPNSETNNSVNIPKEECLYDNGIKVYIQLATGSANNIKPDLVMETFCQYANKDYNEYAFQTHRLELYSDVSSKDKGKLEPRYLVPLNKMYE